MLAKFGFSCNSQRCLWLGVQHAFRAGAKRTRPTTAVVEQIVGASEQGAATLLHPAVRK